MEIFSFADGSTSCQATILDKMLEHGSQDRATLPLPPCNVGLENPNEMKWNGGVSTTFVNDCVP